MRQKVKSSFKFETSVCYSFWLENGPTNWSYWRAAAIVSAPLFCCFHWYLFWEITILNWAVVGLLCVCFENCEIEFAFLAVGNSFRFAYVSESTRWAVMFCSFFFPNHSSGISSVCIFCNGWGGTCASWMGVFFCLLGSGVFPLAFMLSARLPVIPRS